MNTPDDLITCEGMELELRAALPPAAGAHLRGLIRAAQKQKIDKPDRVARQEVRDVTDAALRRALELADADLAAVEAESIRREVALKQVPPSSASQDAAAIKSAWRQLWAAVRYAARAGVRFVLRVRSPKPPA